MTPRTPTAMRPNGKPYTRRKPPHAMTEDWDLDSFGVWVEFYGLVLRTHDVDEAVALMWRHAEGPLPTPTLRWVRLGLCMCGGEHGFDLVEDPIEGVPAVEFMGGVSR